MWNEKDHPRDILGRFTKKEIDDMTADELKEIILETQKEEELLKKYIALARYMNSSDEIYEYAKNIPPIEEFED